MTSSPEISVPATGTPKRRARTVASLSDPARVGRANHVPRDRRSVGRDVAAVFDRDLEGDHVRRGVDLAGGQRVEGVGTERRGQRAPVSAPEESQREVHTLEERLAVGLLRLDANDDGRSIACDDRAAVGHGAAYRAAPMHSRPVIDGDCASRAPVLRARSGLFAAVGQWLMPSGGRPRLA